MPFQTGGEVRKPFQVGGEIAGPQITLRGPAAYSRAMEPILSKLLDDLGGQFPSAEPIRERRGIYPFYAARDPSVQIAERRRRKAFDKLQKMGYTKEQIGSVLAYRSGTTPRSTAPEMVGGTIGSLAALGLGTLIPGPEEAVTVPAAYKAGISIVSAGLGGGIGRGLQAMADPDEEFTVGEFMRAFGREATVEAIGIGLTSVGRKVLGGARKTALPEAARMSAMIGEAGERAGVKGRRVITRGFRRARMRLLPAQFSENQLIDTVQGIGEGSLIGSNTIFQFKRGIRKSVVQLEKELLEHFTKGAERRGTLASAGVLYDTIRGNRKAWSEAGSALYNALDDEGIDVGTKALTKFSKEQWRLIEETGEIAAIPNLNTIIKKAANKIDTPIGFQTGHRLKSALLTVERNARKGVTPKLQTARVARQMINALSGSMETAAKKGSPNLWNQYTRARKFWAAGSKRYDNEIIRRLTHRLRNHPEAAALAVFHPNTAHEISLVKKAAGKKAFIEMRGAWLEGLLKDSASKEVGEEGVLLGTSFLSKFDNMGDDTLNAIFTKQERNAISDLGKAAAYAQQKTGGVGGSLKILQGVAALRLIASPFLPEGEFSRLSGTAAGAILIGPAVVSRMMTNPTAARLLSEGFRLGTGTRQGIALTARLVREVLKTRAEINAEKQERILRLMREQERAKRPLGRPSALLTTGAPL